MIFIAGIQPKTKRLDDNPRTCPSCGSSYAYLGRIDHCVSIFFIPIFPIKRGEPVLICENCGVVLSQTGQALWSESTRKENQCPRCGRIMEEDFSYCPHCGARRVRRHDHS